MPLQILKGEVDYIGKCIFLMDSLGNKKAWHGFKMCYTNWGVAFIIVIDWSILFDITIWPINAHITDTVCYQISQFKTLNERIVQRHKNREINKRWNDYLAGWISGTETGRSWSLSEHELQLLWIQGHIVHSSVVWVLKMWQQLST